MARVIPKPKHEITAGRQSWGGKTLAAARDKMMAHLERLFAQDFNPVTIKFLCPEGMGVGIATITQEGNWSIEFSTPDRPLKERSGSYSGKGMDTREGAERQLRFHIAQRTGDISFVPEHQRKEFLEDWSFTPAVVTPPVAHL